MIDEAQSRDGGRAPQGANAAPWPDAARRLRGRAGRGGALRWSMMSYCSRRRARARRRRCGATDACGCSARTSAAAACSASTRVSSTSSGRSASSTRRSRSRPSWAPRSARRWSGMRPIVEMRIFDFVLCAMDELVNQIAKVRYMFGGQATRAAGGAHAARHVAQSSAAQHSQIAGGLVRAYPGRGRGRAGDAGRQRGAAECGDPLRRSGASTSSTRICGGLEGEMPEPIEPVPFGVARKVARGR